MEKLRISYVKKRDKTMKQKRTIPTRNKHNLRTIHKVVLFVCCFSPFLLVNSQTLSLDSCINLALKNNAKTQNSMLEIEASKQVKKQAKTKYFPNISLTAAGFAALNPFVELGIQDISNASTRDLLNTLYAEYGAALGLPNNISLFQAGMTAAATAIQPIFVGGQIVNGNRLAQLGVEASKLQNEISKQEVRLQTEESYWLVVSLHEKVKTVREAQTFLDTIYHDVTGAYQAGLITQTDVLKVTLKRNELNSAALKLKNGVLLAQMALCQSIGITYSDSLRLTDSLTHEIAEPLQFYRPTNEVVSNRNETKLLDMSVQAEKLKRKMTLGETLPQVAIGATYLYHNLFGRDELNGMVFATIQVPLTNWWETSHKLKAHKIHEQIAENSRRDLTEKIDLQVRQAWNELQEGYQQIAIAEETVSNAQQNLTVTLQNYQAGLISVSELLEAQITHRQAVDQQCNERIAYQIKVTKYKQLSAQ